MTRFIVIDNYSGFVWGEAEALTAIEACRAVDEREGAQPNMRRYQTTARLAGNNGYIVYEAPADFPAITDGQDDAQIEAVSALPNFVRVEYRDDLDFDDED